MLSLIAITGESGLDRYMPVAVILCGLYAALRIVQIFLAWFDGPSRRARETGRQEGQERP